MLLPIYPKIIKQFELIVFISDQCYDYTSIYDVIGSSEKRIGTYCGDKVPSTIQAKTNKVIIRLFADGTVTDRGFLISFSAKGE